MSHPNSKNRLFTRVFGITLGIAIAALLLRGFGLPPFTSIPGGIYMLLILLSIVTGVTIHLQRTWWRL